MPTVFFRVFVAASLSLPILCSATGHENFLNGTSFYGQLGTAKAATRTVDVSKTPSVQVDYGETVVLRDGAEQFVWTFNGFEGREVPLAKVASQGFARAVVYVGPNPLTRD